MEAEVFKSLDRDNDGVLRVNEIKQVFFNVGVKLSDEEVNKLVSNITAGFGSRDVDEACLSQFITENMGSSSTDDAVELFKAISHSQKGLVTDEEIRSLLEANGVALTEEEAGELVLQHKKRLDTPKGTLTVEEFVAMLTYVLLRFVDLRDYSLGSI